MKKIFIFICVAVYSSELLAQNPELIIPAANSNKLEAVAISHDEKYYASGDLDGRIKIWEAATGKVIKTLLRGNLYSLAFTPDDRNGGYRMAARDGNLRAAHDQYGGACRCDAGTGPLQRRPCQFKTARLNVTNT